MNVMELFNGSFDYKLDPPDNSRNERIHDRIWDLDDEKVLLELKGYGTAYDAVMEHARETLIDCMYWSEEP